jgi:carbamoyltransferase
VNYPNSLGLFYSAFTQLLGLKPNEEEYILMGMAAYGNAMRFYNLVKTYVDRNLHKGIQGWPELLEQEKYDVAAAVQLVYEQKLREILLYSKHVTKTNNLVLMGGCALNCVANRILGDYYANIWIMPNPGDAGSSLGAAALVARSPINFRSAYCGHNIHGDYPVNGALAGLTTRQIVGVANGRAEFGPRSLGNRSLFADPRGGTIKETVNDIKQRQQFRPFSPVILEEMVNDYFIMPRGWNSSRYMAVVAHCRNPKLFPAIVHRDGTSRVQTVPDDNSGIRRLLTEWFKLTGCPMLLNTSLNIKGQPIVNTEQDAIDWQNHYGVTVAIRD